MATAEKTPATKPARPLLPPDERFWKRYSAHMELPLASATSIFVHGLVLGILALGGLAFLFRGAFDPRPPAHIDAVQVPEGLGIGEPGGAPAGEPGLPGAPGLDIAQGPPAPAAPNESPIEGPEAPSELPPVQAAPIDVTPPDAPPDAPPGDVEGALEKIRKEAERRSQAPAAPAKSGSAKKAGGGTGNPKGVNGQGGPGGIGKGKRPGAGTGDVGGGRKATEQEIKAWRWRFELMGSPRQHAEKLERTGVLVAVPDPRSGTHLFITDLKRRPVTLEKGDLNKYADSVKWFNKRPESVRGLAQELGLPFTPPYVVLLLPKDREAKMAAEEKRFADQHHNNLDHVRETWFDFRLQNGTYEPVVIRQEVQ